MSSFVKKKTFHLPNLQWSCQKDLGSILTKSSKERPKRVPVHSSKLYKWNESFGDEDDTYNVRRGATKNWETEEKSTYWEDLQNFEEGVLAYQRRLEYLRTGSH
eukprot:CAMPEP_0197539154 /NCGR_PEP_ID=MMETSP1318-20131121/61779_1 /TAXON_ID=552666 /ORGANISM="Partenskyella glossopodia, Strain RCC365" /LENGTH=103 /DNA_ID=CAMNT_0043097785 /DNA_START=50 /DNA_END=361 /DNA_ORIENTATION=+